MRRTHVVAVATASLLAAATALSLSAPQLAQAAPAASAPSEKDTTATPSDDLTPKWRAKYDDVRKAGVEKRLRTGGKGSVERVHGRYAKVSQTGTDRIFVVLADFGDTRHSAYPDNPDTGAQRFNGPLNNQIPKPHRKIDNSTNWSKNYDQKYYQNMYFNRMKSFYQQQSSGKYSISGAVTDWVRVPFNEARYGNDDCGDTVCNSVWFLVRDALAEWTQIKLDAGWSMARIQAYLKTFDKQDRYDYDNDGDFNEPDGYIDHFQIVHAGGDEADGDPVYGTDAIWSHRWNAQVEPQGTGPAGGAQIGGVNVGEGGPSDGGAVQIPDNPTGVWVNDYTIQPENGGLSVFSHEFAHDLGLPDLYDTQGGENSVAHWDLMAQSRGTLPGDPGIGDQPQPFSAWDKFQLGWLDYDVARAGRTGTYTLRPGAQPTGSNPNGLIVLLPDKQVTEHLGDPCATCGSRYYYSGSGDDLDNTMSRAVDGGGVLTATVNYEIEDGFDYAFLEASSDAGETWAPVATNLSYPDEDQSGFNASGFGMSGTTDGKWVDLTATVPDGTTNVRWHYETDGGFALSGFRVDNVELDGTSIGDAETDADWTYDGFTTTTGTEDKSYLNAYFVDNRQWQGRDKVLSHVYSFAGHPKRPNWVDYFTYRPGALITYWDTSYADNDVSAHPGGGEILPVDAHPDLQHASDGSIVEPNVLTADSTFGLQAVSAQKLHYGGKPFLTDRERATPLFDDTMDWWYAGDEHGSGEHVGDFQPSWYGVDVPKTGTTIRVVKRSKKGALTIRVGTSA